MANDKFWQLRAGLSGACVGGVLAWLLESGDFSPLAIYVLLGSWLGAWLVTENKSGPIFDEAKYFRISQKKITKAMFATLISAVYFGIEYAFDINPRNLVYLSLIPLIATITLVLGFEYGLLVTILSAAIADYFYVPALHSLQVDQWEDAIGLAIFVIVGSLIALGFKNITLPRS